MTAAQISPSQIADALGRFQELHVDRPVALAGLIMDQPAHTAEDSNAAAARSSYLAALKAHSGPLEARINLGRLLHLKGELELAEAVDTADPR